MLIPEINIDQKLCQKPLVCAVCLSACPQAVFKATPANVYQFRETPDEEYRVRPAYRVNCSGCGQCVELCPTRAISIEYRQINTAKEG
jgi:NAD-dependent dihydropyrimidine dehydrogenase PreA subunit